MIFEFWMDSTDDDLFDEYSAMSAELRSVVANIDAFAGVERFESCTEPGKFVALGFFDDEAAVAQWRNHPIHRRAQELGRSHYFINYRLRMANLIRDYGPNSRASAPSDSNAHHERT